MEDFDCLDQFLNSPSSSDNDLKQRMPWLCHNEDQNINSYETSTVGPGFELAQDASLDFLISDSDYKMGFNLCEDEGLGCQFDTNGFVPSSSLVTYPGTGGSQSVFQSFQTVPQPSHVPPFEGVSSIAHHAFGQNGTGGFGLEEGRYIDHSSSFSTSLSSKTSAITQPDECDNNIVKPRVRARRGQATDPHSISERIRREKIADRMKNLQELLPNLNKTDKASTLDEIIEYVKFLQLQLKVLSTSRAGEVVPNIQDFQAKGGEGLLVPPSSGQLKSDIAFGSEEIAFERELVKLMDSNVSTAMEFLQTKGLSLMSVSLASAISPPSGAHRPASNSNGGNFMAKPGQAENIIHLIATEPKPKS